MALEDIVNVNVTIASATVTQRGFGTPLIYGYHNVKQDRVLTYSASSWAASMIADGFTATHKLYLAAARLMAQNPRPKSFKIGRKSTAQTQVLRLTPTTSGASGTHIHTFTIEDQAGVTYAISVTEDGSPTVAELCTAIASAINATAVATTASGVSGTHVELTADTSNTYFSVYGLESYITLTDVSTTTGDSADLTACQTADADWYALYPATGAPTTIEACADWAETQPVLMVANTHDMGCLSAGVTSDIMSSLQDQDYARSAVLYHSRELQCAAAGWIGNVLPDQPGAATWKFKSIAGANVDALTATQEASIVSKSGNWYSRVAGNNITQEGWTASGEFIDVTQTSDWMAARLKETVFAVLVGARKVPFTANGASRIYGAIDSVVRQGIANQALKAINPTPVIEIPIPEDVPDADVTARTWSGITVSAGLQGAVHKVDTINVFLST